MGGNATAAPPRLKALLRGGSDDRIRGTRVLGLEVPRGTHICTFYRGSSGRDEIVLPFLAEGSLDGSAQALFSESALLLQLGYAPVQLRDGVSRRNRQRVVNRWCGGSTIDSASFKSTSMVSRAEQKRRSRKAACSRRSP